MNLKKYLDRLCREDTGYWAQRLHVQADYLIEALQEQSAYTEDALRAVLEELTAIKKENGVLSKADVLNAEEKLSCYAPLAKQYTLRMISHAHIDMNWQWGYEETVGVTIDTFRTMLKLLDEYPQFIFTQSQAAVYEIIEKYAPDLLPAIREHVKNGRWEVIATTWVEADKNMSNTESMARHLLYTRKYLEKLLGLKPEQFQVDFEPDTFGHSGYVPEILSQGGVKYYYHCRGYEKDEVYRWRGPAGGEVLALRDPEWYMLMGMDYHMINHVPRFCRKNHTQSAVRFYGVGDHGGGPTRQDLERIHDMQTWPLTPKIIFSRLHDVFHELEQVREQLPVVEQELNFVFTGCYSAQARIKQANRHGEDHLYDCEALCAMAKAMGCDLSGMPDFGDAWKNILFNQFHDILPGSGIRETREHALGIAQMANAVCVGNANRALNAMGQRIATDLYAAEIDPESISEGAGVGFNTVRRAHADTRFNIGSVGRSSGLVRPYTLFNPTQYDREELVELTVWDWSEPLEATQILDTEGNSCPFDVVMSEGKYWQHVYCKLAFVAKVPAFGYANYYITEADVPAIRPKIKGAEGNNRVHDFNDGPVVLENDHIRATFDRCTMELVSLWDKKTETEMLSGPAAYFSYNQERFHPTMSSWIVTPVGKRENLNRSCFVKTPQEKVGNVFKMIFEKTDGLVKRLSYEIYFRNSRVTVNISLAPNDRALRFSLQADWNELTVEDHYSPMLQFVVPFGYDCNQVRYDMPGGSTLRPQLPHDVPSILYAAPLNRQGGAGLVMTTDCKYGYRTWDNTLTVTLFHSGVRPDPKPDSGIQHIEIGLGVAEDASTEALTQYGVRFAHPIYCYSNSSHAGDAPQKDQLIHVTGDARVAGMKLSEAGDGIVLRLTQSPEKDGTASVCCQQAWLTDILEEKQEALPDGKLQIPAGATRTVVFNTKG